MIVPSRIAAALLRALFGVAVVVCVLGLGEAGAVVRTATGQGPGSSSGTAAMAGVTPGHADHGPDVSTPSSSAGSGPSSTPLAASSDRSPNPKAAPDSVDGSSGHGGHDSQSGHGHGAGLSAASCMVAVTGAAVLASPGLLIQDPAALVATRLPARAPPATAAVSPRSVDQSVLCVQRV